MAKEFKMISIFAMLAGSTADAKCVFLDTAEKQSEIDAVEEEYKNVFGVFGIVFFYEPTPNVLYLALRKQAFANLFGALYAPLDNLCLSLQSLKNRR